MSDFDPNGILRTLGPSGIMDPVRNLKVAAEMRAQEEATAEQARIAGRVDMASWMAPTLTQLSPETIMSISENPLATDADLEALSGAEQQLLVENYGQTLVSQLGAARSDKERWDIWSETPTELQFILEEAGIPVPQKPSESGIWGTNVLRRLAGAVTPGTDWGKGDLGQGTKLGSWSQDKAAVLGKKISPVGDVAGTLFKVLDYPVELGLRVDRTMQSAGLPGIGAAVSPFGMIAESAENALDPSRADDSWFNLKRAVGDLPRVWREAGDKNGTFDPSVVARATEALDGDGQKLALALEMAENPTDLLGIAERLSGQTRGTAEFAEAYAGVQALSMDEKFMATVEELSRTRMSFGRDFADNSVIGLADRVLSDGTHFAANSTFGQINGALAEMGLFFVIDPTMAVSKLHRVRKIASLGVDSSRMSHELNKLQGFADLGRRLDEGEEIADVASEIRRLEFGRDVELVAEAAPNLRQNLTSRILTASDAKRIERGRQVDRQFAEFADALNEVEGARTLGQLIQDQPKYAKLLTALESVHQTEPIRNADDVWGAVKSTTNVRAMLSTSSAGRDPRIFRLPSLTAKEAKVARTESWFKKTIDWGTPEASKLDEQLTDLSRRLRNDEIGFEDYAVAKEAMVADRWSNLGTVAKFRQKSIEGLQNVAHSFTQHVPREATVIETAARGETISEIADAGAAAVDFSRLANFGQKFGVPRQVVDEYVDLFAKGSTGERMTYVRLFLGELLTETGFMDDGMRAIYDDFVRKSNHFYHGGPELADNWRYSDLLDDSAIWTKQLSDQVSIPAWTDIVKAKFRTTATRQIAGAPIDFLDRAMNKVWKPLVLMRIGFITRAAGEETASFMLRLGSGTYLKSVLARNATGFRTDAVTGELVSATDLGALANTLQGVTHKMAGWAKVRYDEDLVQLARQTMSATEKSEVRRLYSAADEAFRIGDEARWKELFDEAEAIEMKFIDAYIDTLPKRSQFVMDVNQWAQSKAATMTPAYREFIDESWFGKIIPDRTTMARRILGVGDDLTVDRMNHVWMTAAGDSSKAFSSNERLVAAHYAMMTNPTTARLMARDVAQTIGPAYVPGGLDTNIGIEQMLTEQRNLIVATKANGRQVVQEMRPFRNEFGILHQRDEGFIEATGNMMLRSFNDPVIRDSGALEILGTHIGGRTKANLDTLGIELDELNRIRRNIRVDVRNPALNFLRDRTAGIHSVDRAKLTEVFGRLDNLDPDEMIWMQQRGAEIADLIEKNGLSRAMLFHPNPKTLARDLRTGSIEATMTEVQQAMQSFVRRPDYFVSQQELARAAQAVKRPFARPAGRYAVPLYSPMIDSKFSGRFTELIGNDPESKSAWIADVTANLVERGSVTDTEFTLLIDELVQMRPGQGDGMVTLGGLSFTDPRNAEIVADATNEFVRRVGIEDFWGPDRAGAMDFMGAGPAAKLGGATEMGPIAGVGRVEAGTHQLGKLYPKVGESGKFYRSSSVPYEVLPPESRTVFIELDDGRWVDRAEWDMADGEPTGKVEWVNGASEELGLRELNKLRTEKLRELFTASPDTIGYSDEVFTDQIQALINGVFDSNYHPGLIPPDEVRDAFGPIMAARIPENFGMWNKLVRGWFQGVVDPAMTRIIRTPHYAANMASAMPFADDLYRFQITGVFNDEFIKGEHFVTDDTVAAIHARWFSDSEDLLTSGDEIDEAIWRLREGTIHEDPQAAELLGINLSATFEGKKMKPETIAGRAKAWAHMRAEAYSSAIESASIRATDLTVEFIDDHRYRSQFQSTIRNIVPFWFAEEQFLKRQFRMLAQSPEAIRKGMLFMDGMRHTGMIVQDGEGNELFAYPGTETLNRFILQHTGKVFGFEAMAAFAQPMTTNVDFMLPGVTPSNPVGSYLPNTNTSPMVGVPLTMMTDRFPELGFIEDRLLGNRAGQDPIQQLLPSSAQRLVSAFGVGAFGADRLASSQMRAMQALEIANLGPPENATPMEMQEYTDRVRNYARILNVVDFALYASAPLPSGAAVRFEDLEISKEFREIMFESGLDRNEAFALFVEKYPDHTALNVFTNQNVTGATIPQTQAGHDFLIDNQELLINHPHAAAWLTPPIDGTSDDAWSRRANEQLYETELRNKLAPEQYLQEIYIREAMPGYYDMIEQFQLAIFTARTAGEADALELELADRKKRYLEMHPVFADSLGRNSSRYAQRKQDRDAILAMPREELPEGEHVDQVLNLMVSYAQFEREMAVMTNDNSQAARTQRKNLRDSFYAWARQYVRDFPAADSYFQSVIRLDSILGGVETEFTYEYGS